MNKAMTHQEALDKGYKEFKGEGYSVLAHPKSCFFCKRCTDIFYDYTNGPYMFFCDLFEDGEDTTERIDKGMSGVCPDYIKVE